VTTTYQGRRQETFGYNAGGYLSTTHTAETGYIDHNNGTASSNGQYGAQRLTASITSDLTGRTMRQIDYMPDGVTAGYDRTITYNGRPDRHRDRDIAAGDGDVEERHHQPIWHGDQLCPGRGDL
jgi:hypothetical protein